MARKMNIPLEQSLENETKMSTSQVVEKNTTQSGGEPKQSSNDCPNCSSSLSVDTQRCSTCEKATRAIAQQPIPTKPVATDASRSSPIPSYTSQESSNNGSMQRGIIIAVSALLVGGVFWYWGSEKKADVSKPPISTTSTPAPITVPSSASNGVPKPNVQNNLKEAEVELRQYGINNHIDATSYGHSSDGFLALDNKQGILLVVDRKNHQAAEVWPKNMNLHQFCKQQKMSSPNPIIVEFKIPNAVKDNDAPYGKWVGNMHIFPIYCSYQFDSAGNIIPGMLTSGKGANPSHYQGPLYEQRSVDLANIFLTEALPFWKDFERRVR